MKAKKILTIVFVMLCSIGFSQTSEDTLNIEKATLDYLEGYYTASPERMENTYKMISWSFTGFVVTLIIIWLCGVFGLEL